MSDESKKETEAKRAVVDAQAGLKPSGDNKPSGDKQPGGGDQMPKAKELSLSQKLFIWILIIIVGALFGMSGSLSVLQGGDRTVGGISEREIEVRSQTAKRLQTILPEQFLASYDTFAQMLKIARAAEKEGLMPSGDALDAAVDDFLAKKLPDHTRTYKDALVENKGGKNEVSREELKRFLAERLAVKAFQLRHIYAPAVPVGSGDDLTSVLAPRIGQDPNNWQMQMVFPPQSADQVLIDEAVLEGTAQLPTIAEDDPDLQVTYERLRGDRFTRPEAVTVTIAYADMAKILASIAIPDADAQAYYDAHKQDYPKPPAPDAKPDAKPETKEFADVKAEIVDKLRKEAADRVARKQVESFDQKADPLDGQKDNTAFKQAAQEEGLSIRENVVVEAPSAKPAPGGEPASRDLALADLGTMKDQVGLFNRDKEKGFTTRSLKSDGTAGTWLVLRIESRREAGYKDLSEVKPEVIRYLQGQRGYKAFMEQAEIARAAAEKLGANGIAAYLATPEGAKWNAKAAPGTMAPADVLRVPPKEIGQTSSDSRVAGSLIVAEHPVALVEPEAKADTSPSDVPRARLVQARGYQVGRPPDGRVRTMQSNYYRRELENYRSSLFNQEYQRILEAK